MLRPILVVAAASLLAAVPSGAQEAPKIGTVVRRGRAPQTLSEVASRITLRRPDDGGPVVVSDQNLRELADRGVLSVAGAALEAPPPEPFQSGPSEAEIEEFRKRLEEQELAVAENERRLREFNSRVIETRDPHWTYGPQSQAPGQVSQVDLVREDIQREIDAERQKLEELRREGRRTGLIPRR